MTGFTICLRLSTPKVEDPFDNVAETAKVKYVNEPVASKSFSLFRGNACTKKTLQFITSETVASAVKSIAQDVN
eukprot:CAMPEP_0169397570 /NCGR_PEP_ID=MMETSP1017-20121227/52088_1 /TAXON_ID=342587 /ORGANISM="Karlodinium micrum, Strain CCMP2283" /LENGTH=73 /DNA_ID=CAMNT_0009502317 /DNA_START=16 /DNA_END=234 /DNA_ORIENTATION=-